MPNLDDNTLDDLRELNRLRDHAKDLRKRGLTALKKLGDDKDKSGKDSYIDSFDLSTDTWRSGPHPVDLALLVRVLDHRNLGEWDANSPEDLRGMLAAIKIETLFPESTEIKNQESDPVPVLTAARVMNALMSRPATVFSRASMICYYRIVRELYTARHPDWIIGAARGGAVGRASAFVTGECIRAILAFEKSIRDTITFFESTKRLAEEFERVKSIPEPGGPEDGSKKHAADAKEIQFRRLALDWYAANNLRRNVIALNFGAAGEGGRSPLFPLDVAFESTDKSRSPVAPRDFINDKLKALPDLLLEATELSVREFEKATDEIEKFRAEEAGVLKIAEIQKLIELTKVDLAGKESLSGSFAQLVDEVRNERIPEKGQLSEEDLENLRRIRLRFAEIFRQQIVIKEEHRKGRPPGPKVEMSHTDADQKSDGRLTWLMKENDELIKFLDANKGNSIKFGGDALITLNRLLLEAWFPALRPSDTQRFNRMNDAHVTAFRVVLDALCEANKAAVQLKRGEDISKILGDMIEQFYEISRKVHRVVDPAKQYIQTVLHRELAQASNPARFDPGELVFAATSFGATSGWKAEEQLDEARRLLGEVLPSDGRLRTNRPVHSTPKGLRLIPISFEMTRSLAHLLQKDRGPDLDPKLVTRMLNIFDDPIRIDPNHDDQIGWNFQSAPEQKKPNAWVTAVAVLALDRIVRMLNERINQSIFKRFKAEEPTGLTLDSLIYPDFQLQPQMQLSDNQDYRQTPARFDKVSVAVRLQQMRAHLSRAVLPEYYSAKSGEKKHQRVYAAIFYGPPGTGKTTLAEALACTTGVPLVRLSPGDLMVQGTDVVESRARVIFESLSMLTQAVIVLDEFEPVVRRRDSRESSPEEFKFLVTGMLPKLRTLNKAAKEQSLVYCLATNHLNEIDPAAKREERFDLHIPIYHPDPISRFEVFLYRLICLAENKDKPSWTAELESLMAESNFLTRVGHVVSETRDVSAQSLATDFFKFKAKDPKKDESLTKYVQRVLPNSFFSYVLVNSGEECPNPSKELVDANPDPHLRAPVEIDILKGLSAFEDAWPVLERE